MVNPSIEDKKKNENSSIIEIQTVDKLTNFLEKSKDPIVMELFSNDCEKCKMFAPTFEEFASSYSDRAVFIRIDVDKEENSDIGEAYEIQSIPTVIIFEKTMEKARIATPIEMILKNCF